MRVRVLYFAVLREAMRCSEEWVELPGGASAGDLLDFLRRRASNPDGLWSRLAVAVNQEYADPSTVLQQGDEVALLPPVSGGSR